MNGKKRIRDDVKDGLDEALRLIDEGADRAGQIIDRGRRKIEEGARQEGRLMPPSPPRRTPTVEEAADDAAMFIGRAGKKVATATERGIKRVGRAVDGEPGLKNAIDKGVAVVDRVVEKSVEIAKKGIQKTEDIIDGQKKRRR